MTRRQHFDRHHVAGNVVLATVVGILIEVSVMLSVVKIVNATRVWYEAKPAYPVTNNAVRTQSRSRPADDAIVHAPSVYDRAACHMPAGPTMTICKFFQILS
jgi:hypothetical protein